MWRPVDVDHASRRCRVDGNGDGAIGIGHPVAALAVVARTRARYVEAYERTTGEPYQSWIDRSAA